MDGKPPRVSIGLPVRNGQRFIRQAIDALLAQSFTDFELIICDNASTDDTQHICREYVAGDPRIKYFRNATDLGPAANYNKCFDLSRGAYFRWHAHDDTVAPEHLARCVEVLDRDPGAVVAYTRTMIVDERGEPLEPYDFHPATDANDVCARFAGLVLVNHRAHRATEIFGLMRTSALRQTPLHGSYARGDSVLLTRMALRGRFVELPERLFFSRSHPAQSMQTLPARARGTNGSDNRGGLLTRVLGTGPLPPPEWWDASRRGKPNFPEWNLFKQYWLSVGHAPLDLGDAIQCYAVLVQWLVLNAHKLGRDVIFATEALSRRALERLALWRHGPGPAPGGV